MTKNKKIGIAVLLIIILSFLVFIINNNLHKNNDTFLKTSETVGVNQASTTSIITNKGVFALLSSAKDPSLIFTNSNVRGIGAVDMWPDIEKSQGQYDWSSIDKEVDGAISNNKSVLLRLVSGGKNTPDWALNGVSLFSFIDPNQYHGATFGKNVTIPVFWDPVFLSRKLDFIKTSGEHFSNRKIDYVAASCANASTNDWNTLAKDDVDFNNWLKLGFSADKLIAACEQIIDATASAFPNSKITLSVSSSDKMDPNPYYISRTVSSYGITKYPGKFIIEKNALAAKTPDPTIKPSLGAGWQELYDFSPNIAGQMLWFVTDDPTCRMNSMQKPCDAKTMLDGALTSGAHYGMQFVEVYAKDVMNPDLQDSLIMANKLMGA